ncbi:sigma-70 family RNA polymerase sigma factor [Streptomyces sp. NPDC005931]|uniref:sigma-70 family RNA polymerase sigma factor n=1 Tax=Streptomyces sp. NPDC005931 TaxID=3364737 RepID=UPI0036BD8FF8
MAASREFGGALVEAARCGDPRAQDELVAACLPLVYNIVGRALNGHPDVDDVVQETMLRALGSLASLHDPDRFRSWLVAITMNQIRHHWRDRRTGQASSGLQDAYDVADPGADFVDLTIVRLGLEGQRREVAEATRWLDPDDRALLSLWWLEAAGELTRAEVAAALELSPQHTAVRVQRMKAQLETARLVVRALSATPRCVLLDDVTGVWDGVPSALWRKRIARHVRDCTVCAGHETGLVPAERLLVALGLVPVTAGLLAAFGTGVADAGVPVAFAAAGTEPAPATVADGGAGGAYGYPGAEVGAGEAYGYPGADVGSAPGYGYPGASAETATLPPYAGPGATFAEPGAGAAGPAGGAGAPTAELGAVDVDTSGLGPSDGGLADDGPADLGAVAPRSGRRAQGRARGRAEGPPQSRAESRARSRQRGRRGRNAAVVAAALLVTGGTISGVTLLIPDGDGDNVRSASSGASESVTPTHPSAAPAPSASPSATASASASPSRKPKPSASPSPEKSRTRQSAPGPSRPAQATPARPQPAAPPAPAAPAAGTPAAQVLALTNAERSKAGCGPVTQDDRLARAAQLHSEDMSANDYFDHTSQDGRSFADRAKAQGYASPGAENIAQGQSSAASVMDAWMNSPGHRANILNCSLKTMGVGVTDDWTWTQVFGY